MNLINQINLGNNFVRSIEPLDRLTQTYYKSHNILQQLQAFYTQKKKEEIIGNKKGCSF